MCYSKLGFVKAPSAIRRPSQNLEGILRTSYPVAPNIYIPSDRRPFECSGFNVQADRGVVLGAT
jgi:hypothetical protein